MSSITKTAALPGDLKISAEELAAIEVGAADFAAGRVVSLEESKRHMAELRARRRTELNGK